jgi:hypothetical protein
VTGNSAFKNQVPARMAETGENYTIARRKVIAGHDVGQPPVILRVYLHPPKTPRSEGPGMASIRLGEQTSHVLVIRRVRAWTEYGRQIGRQIT